MIDSIELKIGQSVQATSGSWYRNLQVLGVGGNAVTFLVVATSGSVQGTLFALKVFRRLSKPERRASFHEEIKFLQECNHPSIMRVFDEGVYYDKHPFVVVEYLPETLESVIKRGATTAAKASYTLQLLSALNYLANLDPPVIHRDIKPQNVFVKGHSCVLGDFGLLKVVAGEEDMAALKESVGVGMPFRYRTPDLVAYLRDGKKPTSKSDVYQLGLVIAELFTGNNPQKTANDFTDNVEREQLRPIPGGMAPGIANLIEKMLETDADKRDPASKFIAPWQGVFIDAAKRAHDLDGRVF